MIDSEPTLPVVSQTTEAHIDLLRAYFAVQGFLAALFLMLLPIHWLVRPFLTIHGNQWLVVPLLLVTTWGSFRVRRLLRDRDREGALIAVGVFACDLPITWGAGHPTFGSLLSGLGIGLAIGVFVALRRAERFEKLAARP